MTPKQAKAMRRGQSLMKNASKALRRKWAAKAARTRALKQAAGVNPEINADSYPLASNPVMKFETDSGRVVGPRKVKWVSLTEKPGDLVEIQRYRDGEPGYQVRGDDFFAYDASFLSHELQKRPLASNPELMILSANPGVCRTKNGSQKMKRKKRKCSNRRKTSSRRRARGRRKGAGRKVRYNGKLVAVSTLRKKLSKVKFNRLAKRKGLKRLA